jgi:single-strand DNA-binding protein
MSLNRVILLGRLGRDPEIRTTQSGMVVATLNLATDSRRPDGNNGWKNVTEWHRVVLFGKQGELAQKFLTKGREVLIEGELRTREWQDKQGQKRWTTEVVAQNMRFVGGRGGSGSGGESGYSSGSGASGGYGGGGGDDYGAPVGSGGGDDFGASDFGDGGNDSDIPF